MQRQAAEDENDQYASEVAQEKPHKAHLLVPDRLLRMVVTMWWCASVGGNKHSASHAAFFPFLKQQQQPSNPPVTTTWSAPKACAHISTTSPIGPAPSTATDLPGCTCARLQQWQHQRQSSIDSAAQPVGSRHDTTNSSAASTEQMCCANSTSAVLQQSSTTHYGAFKPSRTAITM
jgi:hypothetical protein